MKFLLLLALFVSGLRRPFCTANVETAAGTHEVLTRRADGAFTYRYLLCKAGSDANHVTVCGASDYPVGHTTDQPGGAEDIINVCPLNYSKRGRVMRCSTAIAAEVDVYTAAGGFVSALPAVAGTYYKVGRTTAAAVQESAGLYGVPVAPCAPVKTIVIAAATGTAATDIAAVFTALQSGPCDLKAL